ncbi:lanosterol synthase [[Candida] jaroonii]|uniref:Lanosterol synthase n=1 Tax=[Candida] jaroonii TaxID=467808 RepID=A0ACA9Y6R3_9ASCO|nr:lanosterol synthase [[Candida] jaroonii]
MEYYSDQIGIPKTDHSRWRLRTDDIGSEWWEYIEESDKKSDKQSTFVQYLLNQPDFPAPPAEDIKTPFDAAKKGADFLSLLMDDCGSLPCQYKGPMFMTIGYVASCYYTKTEIPTPFKQEMIRYLVNASHPVDGGWGLHSVDKSTCFGTTINYVVLRLLGLSADHPVMVKARRTLLRLGGAVGNPHWGKVWLSILNLYEYEGVNPAPGELWMLPEALPIHPSKWWVHVRAIYAPFGYIIMHKLKCELDPLLRDIRSEIYKTPYDKIDFSRHRNTVCGVDLYYPHSKILNMANAVLNVYEKYRPNWVKKIVSNNVYDLIIKELQNTKYLSIAPVSFALDMVVVYAHEGPDSENFKKISARRNEVLFHGAQGMTVMGTNGTQTWDAAFMIQYLFMAGLADLPEYQPVIKKAYKYLVKNQFTDECVEGSYRDKRDGAWGFSTKDQGYTVSDCTAESVKAILMVQNHKDYADVKDLISKERLYKSVDVLLSIQNRGSYEFGSFATYENIRGSQLVEALNPAEVFNNIMVEYPYVECTDSSVLGLTYFTKYHPEYKQIPIKFAIEDAIQYIRKSQLADGSWYGAWGVCYTYATMFALEAFNSVGKSYANDETVKKGCDFLISKQQADGGWSESMKSCETHTYVPAGKKSLVVQTAWSVIGLLLAEYPHQEPIEQGIKLIMDRQLPTGEWKAEDVEGVFNHSCAIEYPSYKFLFTIKALGLYNKKYGK